MTDQRRVVLRSGHATPKNIVVYALPVADASAGTTIYLTEFHATPKNIILRNPTAAPVAGAETGESAAPLSAVAIAVSAGQKASETPAPVVAVATATAAGQKASESASPLVAVAAITSAGFEGEGSAAALSAVATITAAGAKSSETLSTGGVGGVSPGDVERIRRFLKREKEPITKLYKKLVRVKRYVPEASKAEVVKLGSMYATDAKPLTLDWLNFAAILKAGDQNRMKMLINNAILAAEIARAEEDEDDEDTLLLLYG